LGLEGEEGTREWSLDSGGGVMRLRRVAIIKCNDFIYLFEEE
jgi:hypothetical protein